jgi:hypothetical protein
MTSAAIELAKNKIDAKLDPRTPIPPYNALLAMRILAGMT